MKTATFYAVIAIVASFGLTAFGEQACNGNAGGQQGIGSASSDSPFAEAPFFPSVDQFAAPGLPAASPATPTAPPIAQVRITPLNSAPLAAPAGLSAAPSARISLVTAKPRVEPESAAAATDTDPAAPEEEANIDPALAGLVGTWSAVSRYGDGELTTVELQFDDRGWAELTVPAADGKRSTIKRRASLEDNELKLSGPDEQTLSLGKLIELDSRQLILERTGRQITFVRRST
ncbi:MAG: hypothetical protein WD851_07480 [Pirellulales bacterium]